jgi:chromosome segregation protein
LKIKSLTLHGFKSFADRTEIRFHGGITAIVGPNGCGKSNISDSLRWVLGEQRPSAIRGARMEEAIFQGTSQRRPIHRAEVSLTLSNEHGILPVPFDEVVIGRTVLRGGESVYSINDASCRLKDIQDLCRDTGLGANAYSIIEAGMIDAILSDRAEERRSLFEEAAEVGRYKDRRRTALRRLDQAEQDLKRLDDLLSEVNSKVRSLGRQRGKARRYGELRGRRLVLEIAVARARLDHIEDRLVHAKRELGSVREREPGQRTELSRRETEAETLRVRISEREQERFKAAVALEETRARLEMLERERLVTGERVSAAERRIDVIRSEQSDLDRRITESTAELAEMDTALSERLMALAEMNTSRDTLQVVVDSARARNMEHKQVEEASSVRLTELVREVSGIEAETEARRELRGDRASELARRNAEIAELAAVEAEAKGALIAAEEVLEDTRTSVAELGKARDRLTASVQSGREVSREARERLALLEGDISASSARAAGLASMLVSGRDLPQTVGDLVAAGVAGVLGPLADSIAAPPELASSVEAHLGSLLSALVVSDWNAVERVRDWLDDSDADGGVTLLPLDPGPTTEVRKVPGGDASLLDLIDVEGPGETWVRALLSGVVARSTGEFAPRGDEWVTPDGSGQDRAGVVRLGQPEGGKGVVSRRSELREIEDRVSELAAERDALRTELQTAESRVMAAGAELDALEAAFSEAARLCRDAEGARDAMADRVLRTGRTGEEVRAQIERLRGWLEDSETRATEESVRLESLVSTRSELESQLSDQRALSLTVTTQWERESGGLHELQLEMARIESDVSASEERTRRAREAHTDMTRRRERLELEHQEQVDAIRTGSERVDGSEEELVDLLQRRAALDGRVRETQEGLQGWKRELEEREAELRVARRDEREEAEQRHGLELEVAELSGQRTTIRERLEAEWEEDFESLTDRVNPPEHGDPAEWSEELEDVRGQLLRIGPVNLLAADEYDQEKERFDFLDGQKHDLLEARQDLLESIRRINESASASFEEVFEQVRENFKRIFVTLFEGGEADVWLEDPEDPLDSPIEISARPRGKKTQRIHLLSGGERALTALALLFAIYLAKPSPFCIMDEVDAPLDETNIGRFTAMLDEFKAETQFIVITHNARTIEAADWIYGVTMQEPGVTSLVSLEMHGLPEGSAA